MKSWSEITRPTNGEILAWAEAQPWAREMAGCQQDAQWHAEGDVWMLLMSGLPGAKDTWLARHRPELPVVSLDAVRAELEVDATDDQAK